MRFAERSGTAETSPFRASHSSFRVTFTATLHSGVTLHFGCAICVGVPDRERASKSRWRQTAVAAHLSRFKLSVRLNLAVPTVFDNLPRSPCCSRRAAAQSSLCPGTPPEALIHAFTVSFPSDSSNRLGHRDPSCSIPRASSGISPSSSTAWICSAHPPAPQGCRATVPG
jgi:hypothetical protein